MINPKNKLSVRRQCKLLGIQRSTVYYHPRVESEDHHMYREAILAKIDYWHTQFPCAGSRKIVELLKKDGDTVGRKLVRRLMTEMGLYVIYPKENLSKKNFRESIVPYLLRNKEITFPNQVWSIDITYIKMGRSHMYLTVLLDWYSRKIVGWTLSDTLDTAYVLETVRNAVSEYGIPAILNSDQGSQFTSKEYKALLSRFGIRQSMDGKSRWADNVRIERWFRSLKTELIYINEFNSPRELRSAIREYIRQYNAVRPHQNLDYATPDHVYGNAFGECSA